LQQRIGILGGTFNPIHYGHLAAAEEVRERLSLDSILFIPTALPPHKQEAMPDAAHRMEMVRLAISGNPPFELSDIEVKRGGRSYTIDTIDALRSSLPGAELYFLTGVDSFHEIKSWHQWERLLGRCAFVILSRPGYPFSELAAIDFMKHAAKDLDRLDRGEMREITMRTATACLYLEKIPHYDISSTDIRERIRDGRSVKYLLPEPVERYIITNTLYA